MRRVTHQPSGYGWLSPPTTLEGWWAVGLGSAAIALSVIGEAARRADVSGPFYSLAFLVGLIGGVAAVRAVRGGERSLFAVLAVLPLVVAVAWGLAELFG